MTKLRSATAVCLTFIFILLCSLVFGQTANSVFDPPKGSRIILLGNTFADRMRHYGYFETLLQKQFPGRQLTLRNMGWSADEVGLQPRPLNFPGFGEKTARLTEGKSEVTFQGFTHEGEKIVMPVPLNFGGLNQDLSDQKADIIFLCFGMNEAFKGEAGLPQFRKDLDIFIQNLLDHRYNGDNAPQLVLVSPIAHEELGGHFPDPAEHNRNLAMYTRAMEEVARNRHISFIDLYRPFLKSMQTMPANKLTINGIHLNDRGYRLAAEWMAQALGFERKADLGSENSRKLTAAIKMKDDHFFYRWRAVNGEYIYGRRREPFGVIAFPPELRKLNQMTAALDSVIWELGKSNDTKAFTRALDIVDQRGKPLDPALTTTVNMTGRQGEAARTASHALHNNAWPATTEKFTLPKGYEINLFASERDFPIEKPVALNFDAKGRLWVATMPTYPQYFPGIPVHDKIVILEDTDHDGKADKHTVFADDLYLPLGFEFGDGGVYVSQEPDILFLKDTNGDGRADVREVVLTGFGSEDSHHATHAFTFGQDGALYFNEGTFLNTQVETPYGPIRSYAGATYRFEPRTHKLTHYISYPYYNPWGSVFDRWGMHLIGDASDGSNYFAPPMTGRVVYPDKHPRIDMFTETRVRPTAGIEIVSSRQFPDDVQGDFLVNNNIGFQGTKQHRIVANGSGITGKETEPLLQSSDPNFRPIDLEFGPDGALYIVDWYNPLISHGENPPRDPARDKSHGRIWRISYKDRPLLTAIDISKQSIPQLLDNLKVYEDRLRYRSRARLREENAARVIPALRQWTTSLNAKDSSYEHHLLEALWLYQDFDAPEPTLLAQLLNAKDFRARAAATRVLRYWRDRVPGAIAHMRAQVNDESPRVQLEAIVALSDFAPRAALPAALDIFNHPNDYYLDYAIRETMRLFKPEWLRAMQSGNGLAATENATKYLLGLASPAELISLQSNALAMKEILRRADATDAQKEQALATLAKASSQSRKQILVKSIQAEKAGSAAVPVLTRQLLRLPQEELTKDLIGLTGLLHSEHAGAQTAALAALLTINPSDPDVSKWPGEEASRQQTFLDAVSLITDGKIQATFYTKVKELSAKWPETGFPLQMKMTIADPGHTQPTRLWAATLESQPESVLQSEAFNKSVATMKKLLPEVAEGDRKTVQAILENLGTIEIRLKAVEAKMAFDQKQLAVPAGRRVSLIFDNADVMPHNVVITRPGAARKVGEAADAMANLKDGFEKNFIPSVPEVLFATPLVNSGKSYRLDFKAPAEPGAYPFLCSFPGHWQVMQGVLNVASNAAQVQGR